MIPAGVFLVVIVVSAVTRLHAVVFGAQVSIPYVGIVAVLVALALVAAILVMVRLMVRDGLRLRPVVVRT